MSPSATRGASPRFDATHARAAVDHLACGRPTIGELAGLPAVAHLLRHARHFDIDVPQESAYALARHLLEPAADQEERIACAEESIAFFTGALVDDLAWLGDVLRYLPRGFGFEGALYLTYGYDIGVALAPDASLNAAHPRFAHRPRELLYYAIHELHHVGFMTYRPPPRVADLVTRGDILRLVEYCTQLEGMAVHAARERRGEDGAVLADEDYVALEDEPRMEQAERLYGEAVDVLARRRDEPADASALAVIEQMSSGERLWYRVGARMADRIEQTAGREALVQLVERGPSEFLATARDKSASGGV